MSGAATIIIIDPPRRNTLNAPPAVDVKVSVLDPASASAEYICSVIDRKASGLAEMGDPVVTLEGLSANASEKDQYDAYTAASEQYAETHE